MFTFCIEGGDSSASKRSSESIENFSLVYFKDREKSIKKAKKDSDYIYEYTYYVVFGIDQELFDTQLEAAMEGIEDNTDQTQLLKDVLTEKLHETLISDSEKQDDWTSEYDFYNVD